MGNCAEVCSTEDTTTYTAPSKEIKVDINNKPEVSLMVPFSWAFVVGAYALLVYAVGQASAVLALGAFCAIFDILTSSSFDTLVAGSWGLLGAAYSIILFKLGGIAVFFPVITGFFAYARCIKVEGNISFPWALGVFNFHFYLIII